MRVKAMSKGTVPAVKCGHRWGAVATFSHQTDARFPTSIYAAELYGFKANVRLGAFVSNLLGGQDNSDIGDVEATGIIRHDIYFMTDYWKNPTTGKIEVIPDHYSTTWTQAGVNAFENAVLGAAKIDRYPTCGTQMYDLTNGRLGFNQNNGAMGLSNLVEFYAVVEAQNKIIQDKCARISAAGSFRNGLQGETAILPTSYLGIRNSGAADLGASAPADTYYGEGYGSFSNLGRNFRSYFRSYTSSTRWWDSWNTRVPVISKETANAYFISQIQACINQKGWFRDFCHWHSCRNNNTMPSILDFLTMMRTAVGNNFVWTCSNGEALEYLYARQLANSVTGIEHNGKVIIAVDTLDLYKGSSANFFPLDTPLPTIHTPLSIEVDLSNTELAGKSVVANTGKMRSIGNNKYIVESRYTQREGFTTVEISEGQGGYYNESIPIATKEIIGNTLKVTTDMPTNAVLYSVATGGYDYDSLPVSRSRKASFDHTFQINDGKDYRIGIISEFGMATLLNVF
ncbi:hypothetical protein ACR78H_25215 [Sphingobacterium siyangense]|uniref:hypothetical protein n=1 Tax=Sphingobacterium siyangense TaxID=459529 RepID=UPI003DA37D0F